MKRKLGQTLFTTVVILTLSVILISQGTLSDDIHIKFPANSSLKSERIKRFEKDFFYALTEFSDEGQTVTVSMNDLQMSPNREWMELIKGDKLNILISPLQHNRHTYGAEAIPYPVMRGLLGFRQSIVRQEIDTKFSQVNSLLGLKKFTAGQVDGWYDITVYQENDIELIASQGIPNSIKMLANGRFDFLPLGVIEVDQLFDEHARDYSNLKINQDTLIYYNIPMVLYITHGNESLRSYLNQALPRMLQSGRLDEILHHHFGPTITLVKSLKDSTIVLKSSAIDKLLDERSQPFLLQQY